MTINKSLTYANGATLDVEKHNHNIYKPVDNYGIMSTANGGLLADSNMASSFAFNAEHVMPGEVFRGHQEYLYESSDYFGDVNSTVTVGDKYINVAGCSLRVYFPYDVSMALWQCSVFVSAYIPTIDEYGTGVRVEPQMLMQVALDGTRIDHTKRRLPRSAYVFDGVGYTKLYEAFMACPFDFSHMFSAGDGSSSSRQAGWHDLQFKLSLENFSDQYETTSPVPGTFDDIEQFIFPRVSIGIRNARVLTIL